ncbi:MAG: hypothetical protein A2W90_07970 [Bacteroidetes bacterium GWF2_42_66]|nr:MAG: hypothetical protein A2W92_20595 [Bacteroidetes bacterium GWA2_42_15]OFX99728.1 MAG: hypothetical protein A2W89_03135 [Bacteroidetes bacterium GWE2_42_39]OFY39766.1 MAG: hypothetical protein A2W90_07970 [Bacteroidetes bacterium GWF2_42_66]HBL74813.1 hypothetical protein [Prolixibacteraceae bacterium]HCR90566.1 hypothetical protein [Prolixibacteraceae bacterium]
MQKRPNLLKRYFENRYSGKDYRELKEKFETKPSDPRFLGEIQEHWMEFSGQETPDMDMEPVLHRIYHELFMEESRQKRQSKVLLQLQRIAAILFIPLLIGGFAYFYFSKNSDVQVSWAEIQCPKGVRTHFELPDGSSGYLNSGSSLKYPVPFTDDRRVQLSGEAFFDVAHSRTSAFHVLTGKFDIKVLGTRFNVLAFDDQDFEEVTLEKGKVEVYNTDQKLIASLEPDQQLDFDYKTGQFAKKDVNASQYVSWIEGKLIFRDEKFAQVAKRLSRWYNADVVIADSRLNDYVFHATFENEQLEEVLQLIELTTPITYQLQKREKKQDGSFGEKTIVLNFSEEKLKEFK